MEADCVVHTPMLPFDVADTDAEIIRLPESGKNVVSAVSYSAPEWFGPDYPSKFENTSTPAPSNAWQSGLASA